MTQILNQFAVTEAKGDVKNKDKGNRYECIVYASSVATLVAGTAVKLVDSVTKIPSIDVAAATDDIFGFVQYESSKGNSYTASMPVTIASDYSIMTMEANAAFNVGTKLMTVATGSKVDTAGVGTNKIIGKALQKASGSGSLINVLIKGDGYTAAS